MKSYSSINPAEAAETTVAPALLRDVGALPQRVEARLFAGDAGGVHTSRGRVARGRAVQVDIRLTPG